MGSKSQWMSEGRPIGAGAPLPDAPQTGTMHGPTKAEPVRLRRGLTIAQGFETVLASCVRHFQLNHALVLEGNAEALHQTRVAIRRLRSALAVFAPVAAGRKLTRMKKELRWLIGECGDARNFDVYLERDLCEDQRKLARVRRKVAYDRAASAVTSSRSRLLFLDLAGWMTKGKWRAKPSAQKKLVPFLDRRIDHLWSKVARSGRTERMGDRRRHRLRIRVKKLRYALQFADALYSGRPRRKRKFSEGLKQVQKSLGSLHDIATAASMMMLNPWLATEQPSSRHQRRLSRNTDDAIDRLRKAGPYWPGGSGPHS